MKINCLLAFLATLDHGLGFTTRIIRLKNDVRTVLTMAGDDDDFWKELNTAWDAPPGTRDGGGDDGRPRYSNNRDNQRSNDSGGGEATTSWDAPDEDRDFSNNYGRRTSNDWGGGGGNRRGGGRRFNRGGMSGRQGGRGGGRGRGGPRKSFGPNGHDYFQSDNHGPHTASIDETEIHQLLAERLQAKMKRNFDVADSIQAELIQSGVYVHDGMKEWRSDGITYGDFGGRDGQPGRTRGSRSDRNRDYEKSIHSDTVEGGSDELINKLVNERAKFKAMKAYDKADAVREGLRAKFNVLIDDRLRQWSVAGFFGEEHEAQREIAHAFSNRGYIKSATSLPVSEEDEEDIQEKIEARHQAKRDRDFATADSIRDELDIAYGVMINDKLKLWSVGGDFGAEGGPRKPRGVYTRRGGGDLSSLEVEEVQKLVNQRFDAKRSKDFALADELRDQLKEDYNVLVDDKNSEWHVDSDEYVQSSRSIEVSSEDANTITKMIQQRLESKQQRDYETADAIRDELSQTFGVIIDDRTKEWKIVDEESWHDQQFAQGAADSQSSAFRRTQKPTLVVEDDEDVNFDAGMSIDEESASVDYLDEEESNGDNEEERMDEISGSTFSAEELSSLTVVALKERLRDAGLPVSGKKAELVERLVSI